MYPGEAKWRFGTQDVGGESLGEYRRGVLDGGGKYFYEQLPGIARLDIVEKESPVFTAAMSDEGGYCFVAGRRMSAVYDSSGRLTEAALVVSDHLLGLEVAGELTLPDDVVEKLWEQKQAGVGWMAAFKDLTGSAPFLVLSRIDIQLEYQYRFEFNGGIPYAIPGTNWFVLLKHQGDRIGFELSGVDGRRSTSWFNRFLNTEDLPVLEAVGRLRLEKLREMVFPGS
jgi:hypothetical protein